MKPGATVTMVWSPRLSYSPSLVSSTLSWPFPLSPCPIFLFLILTLKAWPPSKHTTAVITKIYIHCHSVLFTLLLLFTNNPPTTNTHTLTWGRLQSERKTHTAHPIISDCYVQSSLWPLQSCWLLSVFEPRSLLPWSGHLPGDNIMLVMPLSLCYYSILA